MSAITTTQVIRRFNTMTIDQRSDGYMDATTMCKANGRKLSTYLRNQNAKDFLTELSSVVQICTTDLVQIKQGGNSTDQATYVHPRVAMHLAQWCSPKFAAVVSGWVFDIVTTGQASITPDPTPPPTPPTPLPPPPPTLKYPLTLVQPGPILTATVHSLYERAYSAEGRAADAERIAREAARSAAFVLNRFTAAQQEFDGVRELVGTAFDRIDSLLKRMVVVERKLAVMESAFAAVGKKAA